MKRDYRTLNAQAVTDPALDQALEWRRYFLVLRVVSVLLGLIAVAITYRLISTTPDIGEFGWGYFLLFASIAPLAFAAAVLFTLLAYQRAEIELRQH